MATRIELEIEDLDNHIKEALDNAKYHIEDIELFMDREDISKTDINRMNLIQATLPRIYERLVQLEQLMDNMSYIDGSKTE